MTAIPARTTLFTRIQQRLEEAKHYSNQLEKLQCHGSSTRRRTP